MRLKKLRALRSVLRWAMIEAPRALFVFACEWWVFSRECPAPRDSFSTKQFDINPKSRANKGPGIPEFPFTSRSFDDIDNPYPYRKTLLAALALICCSRTANADDVHLWSRDLPVASVRAVVSAPNNDLIVGALGGVLRLDGATGATEWLRTDSAESLAVDGAVVHAAGTAGLNAVLQSYDLGTGQKVGLTVSAPGSAPRVAVNAAGVVYFARTCPGPNGQSDVCVDTYQDDQRIASAVLGGPNDDALAGIAVAFTGEVVAVVNYDREFGIFGGVAGAKLYDFAVVVLSPALVMQRVEMFGSDSYDLAESVAMVSGQIAIAGNTGFGGAGTGGNFHPARHGATDGFVLRLRLSDLSTIALDGVGGPADDALHAVADYGGLAAAGGHFSSVADFGTASLVNIHNGFDAGALLGPGAWSRGWGSFDSEKIFAMADTGDGLVLGGEFRYQIDFGGGALKIPASDTAPRGFVAKIRPETARTPTVTMRPPPTGTFTSAPPSITARPTSTPSPFPATPRAPSPSPTAEVWLYVPRGTTWQVIER